MLSAMPQPLRPLVMLPNDLLITARTSAAFRPAGVEEARNDQANVRCHAAPGPRNVYAVSLQALRAAIVRAEVRRTDVPSPCTEAAVPAGMASAVSATTTNTTGKRIGSLP